MNVGSFIVWTQLQLALQLSHLLEKQICCKNLTSRALLGQQVECMEWRWPPKRTEVKAIISWSQIRWRHVKVLLPRKRRKLWNGNSGFRQLHRVAHYQSLEATLKAISASSGHNARIGCTNTLMEYGSSVQSGNLAKLTW